MGILLLKLALAPALVVGATLVGQRWGSRSSGMLLALPLVAGPILLVITIQHGQAFGARAARGSLISIVALCAFCVVFGWMAGHGWLRALLVGWLVYAVLALAGSRWNAPLLVALAIALVAVAVARLLLGAHEERDEGVPSLPPWGLYARAASTAVLVFTITTLADTLGPAVSGVLTPFPVATSVLIVFALAHEGPHAARATLRGFAVALPAFAAFFFVVALALG